MMTLENMRENGVRWVTLWCACGHHADALVDHLPGETAVPPLRTRFTCSACGAKPAQCVPAWHRQQKDEAGRACRLDVEAHPCDSRPTVGSDL